MQRQFTCEEYFHLIAAAALDFYKSEDFKRVLDILFECWKDGGTVYTMGCGGSASTATHFAADLAKTAIVPGKSRIKVMSLVDNIPLVSAWTNDNGWGSVFSEQLEPWISAKDVLIGFSVHGGSGNGEAGGWSQNLVSAMKLAKKRNAKILGFSGFDGGAMKRMADVCIIVNANEEPYATPVIEAMHVVLHHGLIFALKDRIANEK